MAIAANFIIREAAVVGCSCNKIWRGSLTTGPTHVKLRGRGTTQFPRNFWDLIYAHTVSPKVTEFGTVTRVGEQRISSGLATTQS